MDQPFEKRVVYYVCGLVICVDGEVDVVNQNPYYTSIQIASLDRITAYLKDHIHNFLDEACLDVHIQTV